MEIKVAFDCNHVSAIASVLKKLLVIFLLISLSVHFFERKSQIWVMHPRSHLRDISVDAWKPEQQSNPVHPRPHSTDHNPITGDRSGGDVDVALFTIRENRIPFLPRTVHCPTWNRSITFRNAMFNVSACKDADVIMFTHGKGFDRYEYWTELQEQRSSKQLWLMSTAEAAINVIPVWPPLYLSYIKFNISSTFRADSDIPIPYGIYTPFQHPLSVPWRPKQLTDKKNLIAWVASHCPLRTWNRTGLVEDLSRHMPVDVYGKCGPLRCERYDERCQQVFKTYKFYLSLENACCGEYITEKFWEPLLKYEAIPVVFGPSKKDYEVVAPPNSFIHVNDFSSVKDLADYLYAVASNVTLYQSYFEWRDLGYIQHKKVYKSVWESDGHACQLLEYVQGNRLLRTESFDPYGPDWLGSCRVCGTQNWLRDYYFYPYQLTYDRISQRRLNQTTEIK